MKYVFGLDQAERDFAVYPDDTMVVSYPRSGNTWTRFLIANLLHPDKQVSFANIEELVPDTSAISSRGLKRIPRPRMIKTHEYFDHRYPRVIYIVRDPRDVALSYYNFQRKYRHIHDQYPLDRYVHDFVTGKLNSTTWGTWAENVGSWISTRGPRRGFLLLRYEDMLRDTNYELTRIADFLAITHKAEILERAIANSSADRMRGMEKREENQWVATKKHRRDIPFVGAAKAGGWQTTMAASSIAEIETAWGEIMISLGYSLVSARVAEEASSIPSPA